MELQGILLVYVQVPNTNKCSLSIPRSDCYLSFVAQRETNRFEGTDTPNNYCYWHNSRDHLPDASIKAWIKRFNYYARTYLQKVKLI